MGFPAPLLTLGAGLLVHSLYYPVLHKLGLYKEEPTKYEEPTWWQETQYVMLASMGTFVFVWHALHTATFKMLLTKFFPNVPIWQFFLLLTATTIYKVYLCFSVYINWLLCIFVPLFVCSLVVNYTTLGYGWMEFMEAMVPTLQKPIPINHEGAAVLLVTAHPDDECMFFAPTLLQLASGGHKPHILCLSNGGAAGLGKVREGEMALAVREMGIPPERVRVVNDPDLPDGMRTQWEPVNVAKYVDAAVREWGIKTVITFDKEGVSGHVNHRAVHWGVREFLRHGLTKVQAWQLVTEPYDDALLRNLMDKYLGAIGAQSVAAEPPQGTCVYLAENPPIGLRAMRQHRSQWVWYRWAYCLTSRFMFGNTLEPLRPIGKASTSNRKGKSSKVL